MINVLASGDALRADGNLRPSRVREREHIVEEVACGLAAGHGNGVGVEGGPSDAHRLPHLLVGLKSFAVVGDLIRTDGVVS